MLFLLKFVGQRLGHLEKAFFSEKASTLPEFAVRTDMCKPFVGGCFCCVDIVPVLHLNSLYKGEYYVSYMASECSRKKIKILEVCFVRSA